MNNTDEKKELRRSKKQKNPEGFNGTKGQAEAANPQEEETRRYFESAADDGAQKNLTERRLKRKLRNCKIAIFVLAFIVAVEAGFIAVLFLKRGGESKEVFSDKANIKDESKRSYRLVENLSERAASFNDDGHFKASVKSINGYEYLVLASDVSDGSVELCYQNEFPDEEKQESSMKALIRKGEQTLVISESCDFEDISGSLPKIVSFSDDSTGFLFVDEEDGMPGEMRLYNVSSMSKAGEITVTPTVRYYFGVECVDDTSKLVSVSQSKVRYDFEVPEEVYIDARENGSGVLSIKDGFAYTVDGDSIDLRAYVSLGEKAYIGEYNASITFTSVGFDMSYQKFEAYVSPDYEDYGNDRVLTPREEYLTEKVSIAGKNGGYYALEPYKKVPLSDRDYSRLSDDASGVRSYADENGNVSSEFGIDVSYFQGGIDWKRAAEQGVKFAFPRIAYRGYSQGAIVKDECFDANVAGAKEAGIDVGVYIFSQATTVDEGIEEAKFILDEIKDMDIKGPIVFDTEYYDEPENARGNLISRELRTSIAEAFCRTVKEAGYRPMVYVNTRWMYMGINLDELADYDIWYAYYGDTPLVPYDFAIWQYSSDGKVAGIDGRVDMNIMFENVFE